MGACVVKITLKRLLIASIVATLLFWLIPWHKLWPKPSGPRSPGTTFGVVSPCP